MSETHTDGGAQPASDAEGGFGGRHVLVTGCAGFIGSHLAESLLTDGADVIGIDCFNDNYGRREKLLNLRHLTSWDGFEFTPIDLARGALEDVVGECDLVLHLAAEPGVRTSWGTRYEQYLRNNVLATQHLLEALRATPETRFVYASSSSVYGDCEQRPTPETATLRPRSPYGQTKAAMEHLCNLYRMSFGLDTVGLRYFTVFGPRQRPDMAFHRICLAALGGDEFTVFGDGRQTRDFTYVADVVAATRAAALAAVGEQRLFNIGGGTPASLREAIDIISAAAPRPVRVRYEEPERGDVRDTAADTTLARDLLGFAPTVSLADGLAAELEWLAARGSGRPAAVDGTVTGGRSSARDGL
jgi:nucleoside-diphosphate-sugar epimerase